MATLIPKYSPITTYNRTIAQKLADIVSVKDYGALGDGSTNDTTAIKAAIASGASTVYFPKGVYPVAEPLVLSTQGQRLLGDGMWDSQITQTAGFSGVATVNINGARLVSIEEIYVAGTIANGSDAIRITNGQLATLFNVVVKTGVAGVRLISGNSQKWSNVFAESCTNGFIIVPDSGDNTNGCFMAGIRSFGHTAYGLDVQQGTGATGHMHSTWDVSTEGGYDGIRIRGGRYCDYTLYSESNSNSNYDLDNTPANYYFIKNPDNDTDTTLFDSGSNAIGVLSTGGALYFDGGYAPDRVTIQAFAISGSLSGVGVKTYQVTNSSGSTRSMTLAFLAYVPVGFRTQIYKLDNTAGFTLTPPAGITLSGDTGTFGAFAASVKKLEIVKVSTTVAICMQTGA
jgi:hypothetical protein